MKKFQLIGGDLCLDFTNTVGGKRGAATREHLNHYEDLLSWSQQAGVIDEAQAARLAREAARQPVEAERVLVRAVELREAIFRVCAAAIEHRPASPSDIESLNSELSAALGRLRLVPNKKAPGFLWGWSDGAAGLSAPLGPVARAAAELLTQEPKLHQLRQCGGDNCGWLFIDSSRNHSRRWCDMRDCGNRAKVRRHRLKERREQK